MAKSRSFTGIVIALSVLLVLSLTATIALAFFSASRTATTTITFDSGIELEVSGIQAYGQNNSQWLWKTTATTQSGTVNAGSDTIQLEAIGITALGADAFVAIKPTITKNKGGDLATASFTIESGWTQIGNTGWYLYNYTGTTGTEAATKMTKDTPTPAVQTTKLGDENRMNDYAGAEFTCTIMIVASDELQGIEALIAQHDNTNSNVDITGDGINGIPA